MSGWGRSDAFIQLSNQDLDVTLVREAGVEDFPGHPEPAVVAPSRPPGLPQADPPAFDVQGRHAELVSSSHGGVGAEVRRVRTVQPIERIVPGDANDDGSQYQRLESGVQREGPGVGLDRASRPESTAHPQPRAPLISGRVHASVLVMHGGIAVQLYSKDFVIDVTIVVGITLEGSRTCIARAGA